MPIGIDTHVTRGNLPHLAKAGKTYFVTFCTLDRRVLPAVARDAVLKTFTDCNDVYCSLVCVVVMPDHAHALLTPCDDVSFSKLMQQLNGGSSRQANQTLGRTGSLWQAESFDHILRSDESAVKKAQYICNNPVRAGLVTHWRDYPWTWTLHPAG